MRFYYYIIISGSMLIINLAKTGMHHHKTATPLQFFDHIHCCFGGILRLQ